MQRLSPTLLDSFQYYLSVEDEARSEQVRQELLARLRGKKSEPNEAMRAGLGFEDDVVSYLKGEYEKSKDSYDNCVAEIAEAVRGGVYQYEINTQIGDVNFDGCADFVRLNTCLEIKTTKKYAIGKYRNHSQHYVYLEELHKQGIYQFVYLVTDFRNVYREDYTWTPDYVNVVKSRICQFMDYLKMDTEMAKAYSEYNLRDAGYKQDASKEVNVLIGGKSL